jgi:adenylate cyclase
MGTASTRIRLRRLLAITAASATLAPVFNVLTSRATVAEAVQGLVDASLISPLVGGYFLFVRDGRARAWFRRRRFLTDLALSSAIVLALFLVGRAVGLTITSGSSRRFLTSFTDAHLLYAIPFFAVVAVTIQVVLQLNRVIGASVVRYFVTGAYHHPTPEERIFLFVDLAGSTRLAERLGSARYFELLRRFVDDLTDPVLETGGEIYQYAGDEVVITWRMAAGRRDASCVRCFSSRRAPLARAAARYRRDFGVVPAFRGGLHGGPVTGGELGDLRRQIVFVGDILNTAARLEEYAKRSGADLVASGALLATLDLPAGIAAVPCGELALRGKGESVRAYALGAGPA